MSEIEYFEFEIAPDIKIKMEGVYNVGYAGDMIDPPEPREYEILKAELVMLKKLNIFL